METNKHAIRHFQFARIVSSLLVVIVAVVVLDVQTTVVNSCYNANVDALRINTAPWGDRV